MVKGKKRKKLDDTGGNYLIYAVSKGKRTGIFKNWLSCSDAVNGVSGACYKGFNNLDAAKKYLTESGTPIVLVDFTEDDLINAKISDNDDDTFSLESQSSLMFADNPGEGTSKMNVHARSTVQCQLCPSVLSKLSELFAKIENLESTINNQNALISSLKTEIADKTTAASLVEKNVNIASQQFKKSADELSAHVSTLKASYSSIVSAKSTPIVHSDFTKSKSSSQPDSSSKIGVSLKTNNFVPSKCVVVYDLKSADIQKINQDIVRAEITNNFGPVEIDFVNRYKFSSKSPKMIIQFTDESKIETILTNWNSGMLGGSSVRRTQKPQQHVAFIKGVPLELSDEQISHDVTSSYACTSIYRLNSKEGNPLRTVKVHFADRNTLLKAFIKKVVFPSYHGIILNVEMPYNAPAPHDV
jgi:viroplasmin and RNaseH domain-containing protein